MRFFLIALAVVLLPAQSGAQSGGDAEPPAAAITAEAAPDAVSTDAEVTDTPPAARESVVESRASAQASTRNFLYQVLLAAVTALVTALIWKWVF